MQNNNARTAWPILFVLSAVFLVFSLYVVAQHGFAGLIEAHEVNLWAAQVFIDLVLAACLALFLIAPRARSVGVRMLPWTVLTLLTGSIGLYALVARVLYLEAQGSAPLVASARRVEPPPNGTENPRVA